MNTQTAEEYIQVLEYQLESIDNQIAELQRQQGNVAYAIARAKEELSN